MFSYPVTAADFLRAGRVSSEIKKCLSLLKLDSKLIRLIAICAYEAEMNLVIHSNGGKIELEITKDKIYLILQDVGPSIKDVSLAMKEGYSTASDKAREMGFGAGMGLPNMKRNSETFFIDSSDEGTMIKMSYSTSKVGGQ